MLSKIYYEDKLKCPNYFSEMVLTFSFSIDLDKWPVCEGTWLKSSQIHEISSYSTINDGKDKGYYFYKSDSYEDGKASIGDMFDF